MELKLNIESELKVYVSVEVEMRASLMRQSAACLRDAGSGCG